MVTDKVETVMRRLHICDTARKDKWLCSCEDLRRRKEGRNKAGKAAGASAAYVMHTVLLSCEKNNFLTSYTTMNQLDAAEKA